MAEKSKGASVVISAGQGSTKPVAMKLFAIGEANSRLPSYCTSRICSARFVHLTVHSVLEEELNSVSIAVKIQGSRRTLRSAEFDLNTSGLIDCDLDISISVQYPHYLKRRSNLLLVMLQRRKRYKNRRILGYKTLALGTIDLSEVLQHAVDPEILLYTDPKEKKNCVARILSSGLSTQPANAGAEATSEDDDFTSDISDSENEAVNDPASEDALEGRKIHRKTSRRQMQGNLKQKVFSLLKKFKIQEELADADDLDEVHDKVALDDDLIDDLDFDSDSGPETFDNISLQSTPRPHLSPYFKPGRQVTTLSVPSTSHKIIGEDTSRNNSDSHADTLTDEDTIRPDDHSGSRGKPPARLTDRILAPKEVKEKDSKDRSAKKEKETDVPRDVALKTVLRKSSQNIPVEASPRKNFLDQLESVLPSSEEELPSMLKIVNGNHAAGKALQEQLQMFMPPALCAWTTADVKACLTSLCNRMEKLGLASRNTRMISVVLCGGDEFVNAVLRAYVEIFSDKPPELQNHIRFIFVPLGMSTLYHTIASTDTLAAKLFDEGSWISLVKDGDCSDWERALACISHYISCAKSLFSVPIAQAMISFKSQGVVETEPMQMFIPFLSHIQVHRLANEGMGVGGGEPDDSQPSSGGTLSAVGSTGFLPNTAPGAETHDAPRDFSPPNSPMVQSSTLPSGSSGSNSLSGSSDSRDLQLDYWVSSGAVLSSDEKEKEKERDRKKSEIVKPKDGGSSKISLKAAFKFLLISRQGNVFVMAYSVKEKKIQIMRALGKKTKDSEGRAVNVEGITKLICRICKATSSGMKVVIDGCEWNNINFFQISSQWHSTVKSFPLLVSQDV